MTCAAASFTIEKNIPVPVGRKYTYWPLKEMKVGDSILLPNNEPGFSGLLNQLRTAASQNGIRGNRKYTVRITPDGARCWRLK